MKSVALFIFSLGVLLLSATNTRADTTSLAVQIEALKTNPAQSL